MRQSETSESLNIINYASKEKDNFKGKEKIDSWIDDIIKQHKKQLDEIKKNRAFEEPEEKFFLKDKTIFNNKILLNNEKFPNNLGKSLNEKKNCDQNRNQEYVENRIEEINDKVKHSTIESNISNIFSNNLDSNSTIPSKIKDPNLKIKSNIINIKDNFNLETGKNNSKELLEKYKDADYEKNSIPKIDQRRSKSNTNIELTFKSLEDEYSHLDKINPILSPNNNLFLQTDFNSIELNGNEENSQKKITSDINSAGNENEIIQDQNLEKNKYILNNNVNNQKEITTDTSQFYDKNEKTPLRKKIAKSSNTIDAISKYSNLNNFNKNSQNNDINECLNNNNSYCNNFLNNKVDIFDSINNLYNSNSNKHANLDYSNYNFLKTNINNEEEIKSKLDENILYKESPLKYPAEEITFNSISNNDNDNNNKKNIVYSVDKNINNCKNESGKVFNHNNEGYKRFKSQILENQHSVSDFPLKTENFNISGNKEGNNVMNNNIQNNSNINPKYKNNFTNNNPSNNDSNPDGLVCGKIYSSNKKVNHISNNNISDLNVKTNKSPSKNPENFPLSNESKYVNNCKNNNNFANTNNSNVDIIYKSNIKNNSNIEKNNIYNNFLSNNKKITSFLPSESMLAKNINKQKNSNYNIDTTNENSDNYNNQKSGYQRHLTNFSKENIKDNDSSFEEIKNLENIVFIRAKLESKKNQLKELKKQNEELSMINSEINQQLIELESYKNYAIEKIKILEENFEYNQNKFMEREFEIIKTMKNLEESKSFLEEKYVKLCSEEKLRQREMELLNQKIKDMEIILEENEKESFEDYIFTGDCQSAQNKLIELEEFIVQLIKDKNIVSHQFSKILDFQKKFIYASNENFSDDYFNNPILHLENIKNLNEKVFDLSEENNHLKQQLQQLQNNFNKNIFSSNSPMMGANSTQMNTLEINNGSKDRDFMKTSFQQYNQDSNNQNFNIDAESLSFKNNIGNNISQQKDTLNIINSYDSNNENHFYNNLYSSNIYDKNLENKNNPNQFDNENKGNFQNNFNFNKFSIDKNYKNNVEISKTILEPLGKYDNKKYHFQYYPNNLTLQNNNFNDFNPNKANNDNYHESDRNASPCFSNMDKVSGSHINYNNYSNEVNNYNENVYNSEKKRNNMGNENDYYNTKKDTGMSFRKTDRENIFKNNYNSCSYNNLNCHKMERENSYRGNNKKISLNLNIEEIEKEEEQKNSDIYKGQNKSQSEDKSYYEEAPSKNEKEDKNEHYKDILSNSSNLKEDKCSYISNNENVTNNQNNLKSQNTKKNVNKFNNLVTYKREKQNKNIIKPNSAVSHNHSKSSQNSRISKSPPRYNNENKIETNNSNNSYISNENSQSNKNLNLRVLEQRINELENQLKAKENLQNHQKVFLQNYQPKDLNSFENSQDVYIKNTENSISSFTGKETLIPSKNNFKKNIKSESSKKTTNNLQENISVSSKQSKSKNSEKNIFIKRKNSIRNNDKENLIHNSREKNTIVAHSSENYNTFNSNKIPKGNMLAIPKEKSVPKNLIVNNKSVEKKVVYSNIRTNISGLSTNSKTKKY